MNELSKHHKGKGLYGINTELLAKRREASMDTGADARVHLETMQQFTRMYLGHAADLAKSGKKDSAREWCKFFFNSRLLDVLADGGHDVAALRTLLEQVRLACHPLDVAEWETDIQAIRAKLDEILARVSPVDGLVTFR